MSIAIPSTAHTAPEAQTVSQPKPAAAAPKPASSQPSPAASRTPSATVNISTAAQTALQESQETQVQTAKEANHGDQQAVRLLARETAAKKA